MLNTSVAYRRVIQAYQHPALSVSHSDGQFLFISYQPRLPRLHVGRVGAFCVTFCIFLHGEELVPELPVVVGFPQFLVHVGESFHLGECFVAFACGPVCLLFVLPDDLPTPHYLGAGFVAFPPDFVVHFGHVGKVGVGFVALFAECCGLNSGDQLPLVHLGAGFCEVVFHLGGGGGEVAERL